MRVLCLLFVLQTLAFLLVKSEDDSELKRTVEQLEKTLEDIKSSVISAEEKSKSLLEEIAELTKKNEEKSTQIVQNKDKVAELEKKVQALQKSPGGGACGKSKISEFLKELGKPVLRHAYTAELRYI